ncbi:MAG: hypothetical protein MZV49_14130 [Rhodopseudomonas palustris]|nr:hypothetical protein [Rhodopseudomonas palustris]
MKLGLLVRQAETPKNTFPTGLYHVLGGLKKDQAYLATGLPGGASITAGSRSRSKEAEYVYNAPVPQEYELYF